MNAVDKVLKFIDAARDSDDLEKLEAVIIQCYSENRNDFVSLKRFVSCIYQALQQRKVSKQYSVSDFNRRAALLQMQAEFSDLLLAVA